MKASELSGWTWFLTTNHWQKTTVSFIIRRRFCWKLLAAVLHLTAWPAGFGWMSVLGTVQPVSTSQNIYFVREKNIQRHFRNQTDETAFWLKRMCKIAEYGINREAGCSRGWYYGSVKEENISKIPAYIHTHVHVSAAVNLIINWQFKYLFLLNYGGSACAKLLSIEKRVFGLICRRNVTLLHIYTPVDFAGQLHGNTFGNVSWNSRLMVKATHCYVGRDKSIKHWNVWQRLINVSFGHIVIWGKKRCAESPRHPSTLSANVPDEHADAKDPFLRPGAPTGNPKPWAARCHARTINAGRHGPGGARNLTRETGALDSLGSLLDLVLIAATMSGDHLTRSCLHVHCGEPETGAVTIRQWEG